MDELCDKCRETEGCTTCRPPSAIQQLRDLTDLKDGWMNGQGKAPDLSGSKFFHMIFVLKDLAQSGLVPYIFPTPEGGILLEWVKGSVDGSLEIDLSDFTGGFHLLNLSTDAEIERDVHLDKPEDMRWVVDQLKKGC